MNSHDRTRAGPAPTPERTAGEYGEGSPHEATGVGPRNPDTAQQTLDEQPGQRAAARDEQLRELIRQRLTEDPTLDASDVSIEVHDSHVRLTGTVSSAHARVEIEQTVENCGALELDDQLRALS